MGKARSERYSEDLAEDEGTPKLRYGPCVRNTLLVVDSSLLVAGALLVVLEKHVLLRVLGAAQAGASLFGLVSVCCRCRSVILAASFILLGIGTFDAVKVAQYVKKASPPAGELALSIGEVLFVTVHVTMVVWIWMTQCCYSDQEPESSADSSQLLEEQNDLDSYAAARERTQQGATGDQGSDFGSSQPTQPHRSAPGAASSQAPGPRDSGSDFGQPQFDTRRISANSEGKPHVEFNPASRPSPGPVPQHQPPGDSGADFGQLVDDGADFGAGNPWS